MVPSGKHTKNDGKSPFLMGKSTISMAMFNSYFDITKMVPPFFHCPGVYLSIQGQNEYLKIDITQASDCHHSKTSTTLKYEKKNKCCKSLPSTSINCKNSLYLS